MMQWISDFRHAWRALVRTPGFLVTSVATLALAIGAVVGMFSVVNTVLLRPQIGRLPVSDDANRVVVISDRLWSTWFGRDPAVVGKAYFIAGEMRRVIGVMPPEFTFPTEETLLWVAGEVRPPTSVLGSSGLR